MSSEVRTMLEFLASLFDFEPEPIQAFSLLFNLRISEIFRRSDTDISLHSHRSEAGAVLSLRNKCAWRFYLCTDSKRRPMGS